ncbi:hydrogenase maturation nickel metallochaperone HypA [Ectothiorhodospira marina]|nr:hydrogenase maturation nickel metallochaperone HypA [Ectothiorhodospira marina]
MHEMSLAREVLHILENQARLQKFSRVHAVTVTIGPLAAVDGPALHFAFEAVTQGTLAEGAELHMEHPAARGCCRHCGHCFTMDSWLTPCPHCGGPAQAEGGQEMQVKDLQVSDEGMRRR